MSARSNSNLKTMMGRKEKVVGDLTKGIEFLFKKNKVDYLKGMGRIDKPGSVVVTAENGGGEQTLETKNILIATGSESMPIPGVDVDEKTGRDLDRRIGCCRRCRSISW